MSSRPNILLITTDQQRYDTTRPGAPSFLRIPHIDQLSREGVAFTSAYADCPICVPARVSIMTGQYVFTHGMGGNGKTSDVMGRAGTLPTRLRELGYQTAAIGKMHFTPGRVRHGFDEMIIPPDYYQEISRRGYETKSMRHGSGSNDLYPGMAPVPEALTLTSWTADRCVEYLEERRDPSVPFFLWCSFTKPHPPLDPPEPYYSMYRNSPIPDPVYGDWSEDQRCPEVFKRVRKQRSFDAIPIEVIRDARAAYYGLITQVDYSMGRVLGALENSGISEDTLIVFASDHGEFLGDHHTGAKTFFHEPSAHIPLILRPPSSWDSPRGITMDSLVTLADILPTLVRASAGASSGDGELKNPLEGRIDGQDLIALARGELENPRRYLEAMSTQYDQAGKMPDYLAITDGILKYIWYPEGGTEQLFDLRSDPSELTDQVDNSDYQDALEELRQQLIDRNEARGSRWVRNGLLVARTVSS